MRIKKYKKKKIKPRSPIPPPSYFIQDKKKEHKRKTCKKWKIIKNKYMDW